MTQLTFAESACLRLLRVSASPHKKLGIADFIGRRDASENKYTDIFLSLHEKGKIWYKPGDNGSVELL